MSGEIIITISGNLTADPELRFTQSGDAVASFTVASTPRKYDSQSNKWKDGDTFFMRVSAWRQMAENIAESLYKGDRVIVAGVIQQRSYETKEGEKRTVVEMTANDVAASMLFATVKSNRAARGTDNTEPETERDSEPEPTRSSRSNGGIRTTRERASSRR